MWKRYLEREDSKIVGMEWAKQWGFGLGRGMRAKLGDDGKWFVESGGGSVEVRKADPTRGRIPREHLQHPTVTFSCFFAFIQTYL